MMRMPLPLFDCSLNARMSKVFVLVILSLAGYAAWSCLSYAQMGLSFIRWHTHLMAYVYVFFFGYAMFRLSERFLPGKAENYWLIFCSVVFSLLLLELILLVSGLNKTYREEIDGNYVSHYKPNIKGHYYAWPTSEESHEIIKPEYSYWRPTNSLGLADVEWSLEKPPGEKRILALGDSFTEGDGAPFDSTFVALLQHKLMAGGDTFHLMNGGMCGSDPFYNYVFLKDRLLAYRPDVVIQTIGTNDLSDILLRGGMERFVNDGTVKYSEPPGWEPIYAVSCVSRIFFKAAGYNELLIKDPYGSEAVAKLNELVIDLFRLYSFLCRENNILLIVIFRPDRHELIDENYSCDFSVILDSLRSLEIPTIDLIPGFTEYIKRGNTLPEHYYWQEDHHHNSRGYEMMAQVIYQNILPLLKALDETHAQEPGEN